MALEVSRKENWSQGQVKSSQTLLSLFNVVVSFNRTERGSDLNVTTEMIKYFQVRIVALAVLIGGYYFDMLF